MRPVLLRSGSGERITVHTGGESYDECIHRALASVAKFLEGYRVHPLPADAETGDWYLDSSDLRASPGGTSLGGEVSFVRQEADDWNEDES